MLGEMISCDLSFPLIPEVATEALAWVTNRMGKDQWHCSGLYMEMETTKGEMKSELCIFFSRNYTDRHVK